MSGDNNEAVESAVEDDVNAAVNFYVSLGRDDGLTDLGGLIQRLAEMSGVDEGHFTGAGSLRDHSSHVEVDAEVADQVIAGVHGKLRGNLEGAEADATASASEAEGAEASADAAEDAADEPRIIVCDRARPRKYFGGRNRRPRRGGPRRR